MGLGTFIYPESYSRAQVVGQASSAVAIASIRVTGTFPRPAEYWAPLSGLQCSVCR